MTAPESPARPKHRFCTDVARERGEPIEGTGALPERMLLIRWPRGQWRTKRSAAGMSPELEAAMKAVNAATSFGLFVDRVGASDSLPRLHAFPENVVLNPSSEAELIAAMKRWATGERLDGPAEQRITIICCTDSRTDACCARFGFATYKALMAAADPSVFNIMQCNHLGGCRFATSLAVLWPHRQRYGRLEPDEVPLFLETVGKGQAYLPKFKGRANLAEPQQVAEIAALRWAAANSVPAQEAALCEPVVKAPGQMQIEARVLDRTLTIVLEQRTFPVHGKCGSLDQPARPMERWVVKSLSTDP